MKQTRAVESPRLTKHCCVFAHTFTSMDVRVEDKSICMAKQENRNVESSTLIRVRGQVDVVTGVARDLCR